jgi:hypothetical protein
MAMEIREMAGCAGNAFWQSGHAQYGHSGRVLCSCIQGRLQELTPSESDLELVRTTNWRSRFKSDLELVRTTNWRSRFKAVEEALSILSKQRALFWATTQVLVDLGEVSADSLIMLASQHLLK